MMRTHFYRSFLFIRNSQFIKFKGSCGKDIHRISLADRCSIVTSVRRAEAIRKTDARGE